jgi:hypothetical protein
VVANGTPIAESRTGLANTGQLLRKAADMQRAQLEVGTVVRVERIAQRSGK